MICKPDRKCQMEIQIESRNTVLANPMRAHMARRLQFRLDRLALRIIEVSVQIAETSNQKGVPQKNCLIRIRLRPRGILSAECASQNLYVAVDCAASYIEKSILNFIQKVRRSGRQCRLLSHES